MQVESKVTNLAQKLARHSFFGDEVTRQCTPNGARDLPALPREEVFQLKLSIFELFPTYWAAPATFEGLWAECVSSIEQSCKRIRSAYKKTLSYE